MRSPLGRTVTVGVVLLLVGGLSGGWGLYLEATDTCMEGYGVTVDELDPGETAPLATNQVAYGNLSADERRVFREVLDADEPPIYENASDVSNIANTVVAYRGTQYWVGPLFVNDCPPDVSRIFVVTGGAALLLGVLVLATYYTVRELR